jgi:hypothetical protein
MDNELKIPRSKLRRPESVERTGMSRSAQCQLRRQWRLIPVAHLGRQVAAQHMKRILMFSFLASRFHAWRQLRGVADPGRSAKEKG